MTCVLAFIKRTTSLHMDTSMCVPGLDLRRISPQCINFIPESHMQSCLWIQIVTLNHSTTTIQVKDLTAEWILPSTDVSNSCADTFHSWEMAVESSCVVFLCGLPLSPQILPVVPSPSFTLHQMAKTWLMPLADVCGKLSLQFRLLQNNFRLLTLALFKFFFLHFSVRLWNLFCELSRIHSQMFYVPCSNAFSNLQWQIYCIGWSSFEKMQFLPVLSCS